MAGLPIRSWVLKRGLPISSWVLAKGLPISILLYLLAVATLLLLPAVSVKMYVDDNALMPGSASPGYGGRHAASALALLTDLVAAENATTESWLRSQLSRLGLQHHSHHFCHPSPPLALRHLLPSLTAPKAGRRHSVRDLQEGTHSGHSSSPWQSSGAPGEADVCRGRNLVTRVQSQRGRGDESVVLVTPLAGPWIARALGEGQDGVPGEDPGAQGAEEGGVPLAPGAEDAVGLAFGLSLLQLFAEAKWLARDVIWVVADAACGADVAVHHWLSDYYSGQASSCSQLGSPPQPGSPQSPKQGRVGAREGEGEGGRGGFLRSGMLLGAVVFHVEPEGWGWGQGDLGRAIVRANGLNGHMPNMDLPAVAAKLADWMFFPVRLGASSAEGPGGAQRGGHSVGASAHNWAVVRGVASVLDWVKSVAASLGVQTKELASGEQYRQRAPQLLEQIVWQLQGTSPGAHGPFREYQVDAMSVSVEATNRAFWKGQNQQQQQQQQQGAKQPTGQKGRSAGGRSGAPRHHRVLQANEVPFSNSIVLWGRLLESVVRCLSNLSERLHHSHFFYLLCSLDSFLPITHYLAPLGLLLLPLALAATHGCAGCTHSLRASGLAAAAHPGILWLACGMLVLSFVTWGGVVTLLPALLVFLHSALQPLAPAAALALGAPLVALTLWGLVSLASLVALAATWQAITRPYFLAAAAALCPSTNPSPTRDCGAPLETSGQQGPAGEGLAQGAPQEGAARVTGSEGGDKQEGLDEVSRTRQVGEGVRELERLACLSLAIGCSAVGLAAACAVNFAVAVAGALVLVPLYLLALPWARVDPSNRPLKLRQRRLVAFRVLAFLGAMLGGAGWAAVASGAPLDAGKVWLWVIWAIVEMHVGYLVGMLVVLPSAVCCLYVNIMP